MDHGALLATLPTEQRLALAYAPAASRAACLSLLALDARLAGLVRNAREPILGQIQLAWWREQILADPARRPGGEPLLALLGKWHRSTDCLIGLVDAWEALLGQEAWNRLAIGALADARSAVWEAIADPGTAQRSAIQAAGRGWALTDLAMRCSNPEDRNIALELSREFDWQGLNLPQNLRPLAVLYGLARRSAGSEAFLNGPLAMLAAIRLGLLGR